MKALPQEEKLKINKLNEGLILEKNRLISEVNKWDEQGNEIIVLAKKMCMIMMDMSDFTRFVGVLVSVFLSFLSLLLCSLRHDVIILQHAYSYNPC